MEDNRRGFLKVAGLTVLGVGTSKLAIDLLTNGEVQAAEQEKIWCMIVDTTKCLQKEGCRDCMQACHLTHNVPNLGYLEHEIKWIWKEPYANTFPQQEHKYINQAMQKEPVVVMCNHCDNPPCVRVCPTQATFKRTTDGIVMMDMHRCIGCRFCMAACPYGSRSFNYLDPRKHLDPKQINPHFPARSKGVVEKCNFCAERLAKNLQPACVEACKNKALIFGDLKNEKSQVRIKLQENYTIRRKPSLGTGPEVYYLV